MKIEDPAELEVMGYALTMYNNAMARDMLDTSLPERVRSCSAIFLKRSGSLLTRVLNKRAGR